MRYIIFILFFFISVTVKGQAFTQTFVDRCTGEVQVVTANFVNGSATVAFYNRVRTFTYQEFVSGQLQAWLLETYSWWYSLSPCSAATAQVQQAQQAVQNASSIVNTATTNIPTNGTTTVNTTNNTTTTNQSSTNNNTSGSTQSNDTSGSTGGETTTETSSGSSESSGETKTEETTNSETESNDSSGEGETSENENSGDDSDDGSSSEEDKGEDDVKKKEEKKKEEKKEKKKTSLLPIQLRADAMSTQSPIGTFDYILNFGLSQSSLYGDKTYTANLMVWHNLGQASLSAGLTRLHFDKNYGIKYISSNSVSYSRNYKTNVIMYSTTQLKPLGKYGTVGIGGSFGSVFERDPLKETTMISYMGLYTNSFKISNRITYSPALIFLQTPIMSTNGGFKLDGLDFQYNNDLVGTTISFLGVLSNSFTLQLTKRFSMNMGWTIIKSTDRSLPTMNSFMVGAKLPF